MKAYAYVPGPPELQSSGIEADSFEKLANIAVAQAMEMKKKLAIVCGPLSTGGTGHQMMNFHVFNATIAGLKAQGSRN